MMRNAIIRGWTGASTSFAAACLGAMLLAASACVTEPEPLDKTQSESVNKAIFQGEWYYKVTVTDTEWHNPITFIGDVTGQLLLAHVASAMGVAAAENIAGVETVKLNYRMMPRATYSHPQVASFGYTEAEAKEQGFEVKVGRFPLSANGKALGLNEKEGFVKIIADAKYGEILGAHLVGPEVTELLPELALARTWELTTEEIARTVHAHPTISEALMEAAHGVMGQAIHI